MYGSWTLIYLCDLSLLLVSRESSSFLAVALSPTLDLLVPLIVKLPFLLSPLNIGSANQLMFGGKGLGLGHLMNWFPADQVLDS